MWHRVSTVKDLVKDGIPVNSQNQFHLTKRQRKLSSKLYKENLIKKKSTVYKRETLFP